LPGVLLSVGLLLVLTTACPGDWAKDGPIDRAMRKDTKESGKKRARPQKPCPPGQDWEWVPDEEGAWGWACQ
jgi:hypothetical protein